MATYQAQGARPKPPDGSGRPELRLLLTVAALASVLSGWAAIAQGEQERAAAPAGGTRDRQSATVLGDLAPLPHLEPLPRVGTMATEAGPQASNGRRAAPPGVVNRAPRPFAITRSSR